MTLNNQDDLDLPELDEQTRASLSSELAPAQRQWLLWGAFAVLFTAAGVMLGLWLAPETPVAAASKIAELQTEIELLKNKNGELERSMKYQVTEKPVEMGKLPAAERQKIEREGRRYVSALRRVKAQSAAELMEWFVKRWIQLLDQPEPDDRVNRRAATLSLLIGGMASNLNPGDYVPWQAEFFNSEWLAELHYDLDNDGFPGKRTRPNARDGFANVSVCQIAMAINQAVSDAQILVMPDMRCDRPDARISVFLQGATWDEAITEFVRAVRSQKFVVVERQDKGVRLILVGSGKRSVKAEEE